MKSKRFAAFLPHVEPLDLNLNEDDVGEALHAPNSHAVHQLFGQVAAEEILADMAEKGLTSLLDKRGYVDFRLEVDKLSPFEEATRLIAHHPTLKQPATLVDLRAHWGQLKTALADRRALVWDWIEFADPTAKFPPMRPPLPGQTYPGLALFGPFVELMKHYVARTEAQALVAVPQYFHNAVLYWKNPSLRFRFLDPLRQGQLLAQMRDLMQAGLAAASWAFEDNRVEQNPALTDGGSWEPCPWMPAELVLGLAEELLAYLDSPSQHEQIEVGQAYHYRIAAVKESL